MKRATYLDERKKPFPFCPGCSHGKVLEKINEALLKLNPDPKKIVVVSDIGCIGLSDQWFLTHALHGLHGRSVAYAQGIKLSKPELKIIVLMGDGASGIGGHHLLSAARRNIGLSVFLCNNFNYGMTGGQHSVTTPENYLTSSSLQGNLEEALKIPETLYLNGATFVARRAYYDRDLISVMAEAIAHEGFSLVEILESCPAYFGSYNAFSKQEMEKLISNKGLDRKYQKVNGKQEYTQKYFKTKLKKPVPLSSPSLVPRHKNFLGKKLDIVIAGSAGGKIISTVSILARAAILSGLYARQRDDYPVTVRSGYSISFLTLGRDHTETGDITSPDILLILSQDGLNRAGQYAPKMRANQQIYIMGDLLPIKSRAKKFAINLDKTNRHISKKNMAFFVLGSLLKQEKMLPLEAFKEAIQLRPLDDQDEKFLLLEKSSPIIFIPA